MANTHETRHISVTIDRPWEEVYEFTHVPANFPRWATGLAEFLEGDGDDWAMASPDGATRVRFTPRNELGVMDHWVTPAPDVEVYVPFRVVPNGTGSEVTITLFRTPGMTDELVERDADWIARDLATLKGLLEA